jgi:hypothetical protein
MDNAEFPSGGLVPDAVHFVDERESFDGWVIYSCNPSDYLLRLQGETPSFPIQRESEDEQSVCILRQRPDAGLEGTDEGHM